MTKIGWDPSLNQRGFPGSAAPQGSGSAFLATTSDCLRLWRFDGEGITEQLRLFRKAKTAQLPPMTSFDWNKTDPSLLISCSVDTTCTLWDLQAGRSSAKTQLIAHDSEVFDVKFITGSTHNFASVGADGSLRLFDLRSLDRSTILYETPQTGLPLLRVEASPSDPNILSALNDNSRAIVLLDIRNPSTPVALLEGHEANVNSISFHPTRPLLLSGADDCQTLVWDLTAMGSKVPKPPIRRGSFGSAGLLAGQMAGPKAVAAGVMPDYAYTNASEVNRAVWSGRGNWIGVVSGRSFQGVRFYG